jgi:hypothetical protein
MAIDFDTLVNAPLVEIFGEAARPVYTPVKSVPNGPAFAIDGIFDREHEIILDEVSASEQKAAGHSTTAPVLSVRLASFASRPKCGDEVAIGAEVFLVWDVQPDGRGMADLVLREKV